MVAVPGYAGVTEPTAAGMVCGVVELNSSCTPVMVTPLVSFTTAVSGSTLFRETFTLVVPAGWLGAESVIEAGGHVEKKPELIAEEEFETRVAMTVEPGWFAVATPFWSMLTTLPVVCAEKLTWPTWQVMLFAGAVPLPA